VERRNIEYRRRNLECRNAGNSIDYLFCEMCVIRDRLCDGYYGRCVVGYVMTYGAFGTDPPTPFGVGGLNRRRDDPIRVNPRSPVGENGVLCTPYLFYPW